MNENNSVVQRDSFQVCSKKRGGYLFEIKSETITYMQLQSREILLKVK